MIACDRCWSAVIFHSETISTFLKPLESLGAPLGNSHIFWHVSGCQTFSIQKHSQLFHSCKLSVSKEWKWFIIYSRDIVWMFSTNRLTKNILDKNLRISMKTSSLCKKVIYYENLQLSWFQSKIDNKISHWTPKFSFRDHFESLLPKNGYFLLKSTTPSQNKKKKEKTKVPVTTTQKLFYSALIESFHIWMYQLNISKLIEMLLSEQKWDMDWKLNIPAN